MEELLPEAFAVVKETCRRLVGTSWEVVGIQTTWDMVPYDVQLIGALIGGALAVTGAFFLWQRFRGSPDTGGNGRKVDHGGVSRRAHDPAFTRRPAMSSGDDEPVTMSSGLVGAFQGYGRHLKHGFRERPLRTAGGLYASVLPFGLPAAYVLDPGGPRSFVKGYLGEREDES